MMLRSGNIQERAILRAVETQLQDFREPAFTVSSDDVITKAIRVVSKLVKTGIDINTPYRRDGGTLLHYVVESLNQSVTAYLLRHKANPNAMTVNKETPLHVACSNERIPHIKILIEHGALIDEQRSDNSTPLHLLIRNFEFMTCHRDDAIQLLLDNGADINLIDDQGKTPLYFIARCILQEDITFHKDLIKLLIWHVKKLLAIGIYVSDENLKRYKELMMLQPVCPSHETAMLEELQNQMIYMTQTKVCSSCTLWDVTNFQNINLCARILRNRDTINFINKMWPKLQKNCPDYAFLINLTLKRGARRRELLDEALEAFQLMTKSRLPVMCTEHILSFLSSAHMKKVIKAGLAP